VQQLAKLPPRHGAAPAWTTSFGTKLVLAVSADTVKAFAALAWPVLAAVILLALLPTIKAIARSRPFKIKFGDIELSVEDASEQLRKQVDDLQTQVSGLLAREGPLPAGPAPEARPAMLAPLTEKRILWVDDRPDNNAYEIAKLQKDGYDIQRVVSTEAALDVLRSLSGAPEVIISDMGRREGLLHRKTAGLELIREVRSMGSKTPIFIYSSAGAPGEYSDQVRSAGGDGITSSPIVLFRLIETATAPKET
jgi:CheY-like chemotaxis protein